MPYPRYTTRFVTQGHILSASEELKNEAHASLEGLADLLPSGIDPEQHPDLLFVAANLAVGGSVNANDDSVSIEDSLATYKRFEMKLCDVEHDRKTVVGFILKAGLSELGTNRLITEDEARAANVPFNITTITVLWKVAAKDLCNFIQESSAPGSPDKDSLSLSFEVGFDDYDIVTLPKGVTDLARATHTIASASPDFERYDKLLRVNKGKGVIKETGERVVRTLAGKIVPLGEGIVTVPAAAVKGLLPILGVENDAVEAADAAKTEVVATDGPHTYSSTHVLIPEEHASKMRQFAASIPNEHIYDEPGYGREMDAHATVVYGIKSADHNCIAPHIANHGPVTACFGEISAFERDEKPYDVLKITVDSPDLTKLHHFIRANTDCHVSWPDYNCHATLGYLKKGMAKHYVGDTRFSGIAMTFDSLVFSPHSGDKTTLPLTTKADDSVYSSMSMNRIKLSQGWKERFASFKANDPLVNGVNVTLSDGRVLKNLHVFNGEELELDKTLSMEGAVITDMTPGNPPQMDDSKIVHPHVGDQYPTVRPEKRAEEAAFQAEREQGAKAPYLDACARLFDVLKNLPDVIASQTRVSLSTSESHTMNLEKLNQAVASLQKADPKEAAASIVVLADEIAKASEEWSKTEKARLDAVASEASLKTEVAELKAHLAKIEAAQVAAEAEAKFQGRMTALNEAFELSDDVCAMLMEDVRACKDDEAFAKMMDKNKKLGLKKKVKADDMEAAKKAPKKDDKKSKKVDDSDDDDDDSDDAKAAAEAIASAQADVVDADVNNNLDVKEETLAESMQKVFARNITIDGVKAKKLIKQSIDQDLEG